MSSGLRSISIIVIIPALALVMLAGCGKKGPPLPPLPPGEAAMLHGGGVEPYNAGPVMKVVSSNTGAAHAGAGSAHEGNI